MNNAQFPFTRMRRTRMQEWTRRLVAENQLSVADLIWPVFIMEGEDQCEEIAALPNVYRFSIDRAVNEIKEARDLGIPAVALFPVTPQALKTEDGREALNPENLICRAVKAIKKAVPDIGVICDVALDPYTSHGHDGLLVDDEIINDESVAILVQQALNQARAGCDVIAPSDMQDGRVGAIRDALEEEGFTNTLILAYTAKYSSAFYAPFRQAIGSDKNLASKDKKSYQQDLAKSDESLREAALDIEEGADMLMVKPGLPYLDIIHQIKSTFKVPTFAYQVTGEYSMIATTAALGRLDFDKAMFETLTCIKRAGADAILTYAAKHMAKLLKADGPA